MPISAEKLRPTEEERRRAQSPEATLQDLERLSLQELGELAKAGGPSGEKAAKVLADLKFSLANSLNPWAGIEILSRPYELPPLELAIADHSETIGEQEEAARRIEELSSIVLELKHLNMDAEAAESALSYWKGKLQAASKANESPPVDFGLTLKQAEVAHLYAERHTAAEIADALGISPRTVKSHVSAIGERLKEHYEIDKDFDKYEMANLLKRLHYGGKVSG